jgi:hypothetical protein
MADSCGGFLRSILSACSGIPRGDDDDKSDAEHQLRRSDFPMSRCHRSIIARCRTRSSFLA